MPPFDAHSIECKRRKKKQIDAKTKNRIEKERQMKDQQKQRVEEEDEVKKQTFIN